jgi:tRNA threonylcarbamoyl adenosine modification protein YeaZ
MNVLGIDAAAGGFSAAFISDGQAPVTIELAGNVALEGGLRAISEVLPGESSAKLDRIGVGIGPGGFTGARIAISYAKSLALGWKLPLCGISTFDAFEAGLQLSGRPLLTAVRGRTGVVSARLRARAGEHRASGYIRDVLAELQPALPKSFVLTGNGAEDVRAALGERGTDVEILARAVEPAALAIAMLAAEREPARSLHEVRADYGELPAAQVPKL